MCYFFFQKPRNLAVNQNLANFWTELTTRIRINFITQVCPHMKTLTQAVRNFLYSYTQQREQMYRYNSKIQIDIQLHKDTKGLKGQGSLTF